MTVPTYKKSNELFENQAGEAGNSFSDKPGILKAMALFSKAAYYVQPWENPAINDPSSGSKEAYDEVKSLGWSITDLPILTSYGNYKSSSTSFSTVDGMDNGFYTHANAAALIAESADALVLAFRGTNDAGKTGENPSDPSNAYSPDKDHWDFNDFGSNDSMSRHYGYFSELFSSLNDYLSENKHINKIYVTGHSMGGAMAIKYMSEHADTRSDLSYESMVFAAAPYTYKRNFLGFVHRKDFKSDDRITQIELAKDPVVMSWDAGIDNVRPGNVVRVHGDKILKAPDDYSLYMARDENHSMDYYLEAANSIDVAGWQYALAKAGNGDVVDVLIGGDDSSDNSVVMVNANDNLSLAGVDIGYGGEGNDVLNGSNAGEVLMGGQGADQLFGGAGSDTLRGGLGHDWLEGGEGNDTIAGGGGNDQIRGGSGYNKIDAGAGNDHIVIQGFDKVVGGSGVDTITLSGNSSEYSAGYSTLDGASSMTLFGVSEGVEFSGVEIISFQDQTYSVDELFPLYQDQYSTPNDKSDVDFRVSESQSVYFLLELSGSLEFESQVSYSTRDGSALAGRDFIEKKGILLLAPGETRIAVEVELIDDDVMENDEYFSLVVSDPVGGSFASGMIELVAQRTIMDNDGIA